MPSFSTRRLKDIEDVHYPISTILFSTSQQPPVYSLQITTILKVCNTLSLIYYRLSFSLKKSKESDQMKQPFD